jgi:hypothetical protein
MKKNNLKRNLLCAAILFSEAALLGNAFAQEAPQHYGKSPNPSSGNVPAQSHALPLASPPMLEPQPMAKEIQAIRDRLGGSVITPLFPAAGSAGDHGQNTGLGGSMQDSWQLPSGALEQEFIQELARLASGGQAAPDAGNRRKATELRLAARQLEQSAARFEAVGLYDDADRLREMARDFWRRARQ